MKKQLKKTAAVLTAAAILTAGTATGAVTVSAAGSIGCGGTMGVYTPSSGVVTQQVLFAMPGSWTNQMTAQQDNVAGAFWWIGADNVFAAGGDSPGYKTTRVEEDGVQNLFSTRIPAYGNGSSKNANMMFWDNYLDPGIESDPRENPYYAAAALTDNVRCSFISREDGEERFEPLFRYTYQKQAQLCGLSGAAALNRSAETFWEDINRLAAGAMGESWSSLSDGNKKKQIDAFFDEHNELLDFSEYGSRYSGNFFNEDFADEIYPKESPDGFGISFTYDNMVYVVDLDAPVSENPVNGHALCKGDFYFYYGGGQYGVMPTKALNTALGCEQGSFVTEKYLDSSQDGKITLSSVSFGDKYLFDESELNDKAAMLDGTSLHVTYAEPYCINDWQYDGDNLSWDGEKYVSEVFPGESITVTGISFALDEYDSTVMRLTLDYGDRYACDESTVSVNVYITESYKGRTAKSVTLLQKPGTVFERRYTYGDNAQCIPLHMDGAQVRVDYENGDSELLTFGKDCVVVSQKDGMTTAYSFGNSHLKAFVRFDSTMKDYDVSVRIVSSEGYVYSRSVYEEMGEIRFTARHIHKSGDIDGDGSVTISDVTAIQRYLAEMQSFYEEERMVADTNADGVIDISDATYLQMYLAGYDVVLA